MLGYFRPTTVTLSEKNRKLYKSVYCKLCKVISWKYGKINTLFIQHDLVFLLFVISKNSFYNNRNFEKSGCAISSIKRVNIIEEKDINNILPILADICIFTVYTAYLNREIDQKGNYIKNKLFYNVYKKSFLKCISNLKIEQKSINELKEIIYKETYKENNCERSPEEIIDPICNYYSKLIVDKLNIDKELNAIPYNMCKIMYYLDSLDDFKIDKAQNKFNILNEIYESDIQIISFVERKVFDSIRQIRECTVNNENKSIVENILNISIICKLKSIRLKYE